MFVMFWGPQFLLAKTPDEVCPSHTKRVGKNKKLQVKKIAEVLLTGLSF